MPGAGGAVVTPAIFTSVFSDKYKLIINVTIGLDRMDTVGYNSLSAVL